MFALEEEIFHAISDFFPRIAHDVFASKVLDIFLEYFQGIVSLSSTFFDQIAESRKTDVLLDFVHPLSKVIRLAEQFKQ